MKAGYQGMEAYREQGGAFFSITFQWRQRMLTEQLVAIYTALEQPEKAAEYTRKLKQLAEDKNESDASH